jgi:HK97 family phage prohead protease
MTDIDTTEVDNSVEELGARLPVEYRHVGELEVRFAQRIIELVAIPYDRTAIVEYRGRMVTESVAPGSFDGVERRANRIKVNREHEIGRPIGRAVALHPSRTEGLVAELRMAQTPGGDEALALADDGVLDASVGFAPFPGHEQWSNNRSRRHITKAFLHHISLVADAAYEDARVLAVRSGGAPDPAPVRQATPNLDQVRSWLLQDRLAHPVAGQSSGGMVS